MMRRLFNLTAWASLAFLVPVIALWVRSYYAVDAIAITQRFGDPDAAGHGHRFASLSWSLGTMSAGGTTVMDRLPPDERVVTWTSFPASQLARRDPPWLRFQSSYSAESRRPPGWSRGTIVRAWRVTVPCWAVTVLAGLMPAWWAVRRWGKVRGARRAARGCCARCGYDLRGSAGRCPECGTARAVPPEPLVPV